MAEQKCSCASFERLEGASVPAYTAAFLAQQEKNRYRCRVCGIEWEKREPEIKSAGTRPSLLKLKGAARAERSD
jgi:hypothetical protein